MDQEDESEKGKMVKWRKMMKQRIKRTCMEHEKQQLCYYISFLNLLSCRIF